jgi:hypothetical protein
MGRKGRDGQVICGVSLPTMQEQLGEMKRNEPGEGERNLWLAKGL